jgi:hypothetical protein
MKFKIFIGAHMSKRTSGYCSRITLILTEKQKASVLEVVAIVPTSFHVAESKKYAESVT